MNGYVNPIAVGLRILDDYRALIVESLKSNGLDGTSVEIGRASCRERV